MFDIAIIGTGPAGTCAARQAAQAGLKVCLIEKLKLPRYKTCGGGILGRAARHLGEPIPVCERECRTAEFVLTPDLRFSVSRPDPIVYMTMRDSFDQWLTQRAIAAGAELKTECSLTDVKLESDQIRLTTTHGELTAKYVIAADGANSLVAKKSGWPPHRIVAPALECEVQITDYDFARYANSARFDFHIIPKGYGWIFPKKGHLSIGVGMFNPDNPNLNHCFDQYMEYLGLTNVNRTQRHGFVIPLAPRQGSPARDRIFLTGDAAGFADPVTAEGIGNAILSGKLAGQAIADHFTDAPKAAKAYIDAVGREILPDLRWGQRLAKLLYGPESVRDMLFRKRGQRMAEAMTEVVAGKTSYSKLLGNPSSYIRLLIGG